MPDFCAQSDVERALGGADVLKQLLDPNFTGTADAQSVADILDEGTLTIASYLEPVIDTTQLSTPYPRILVLKTADVCAYLAYTRGSKRQGVPENVQRIYDEALKWAQDVRDRRAGLAVAPRAAFNEPVEMVDPNTGQKIPQSTDWELSGQTDGPVLTMGAFRRSGFR